MKRLAEVADIFPHAAYAAFTHGLFSRWSYLMRTIPDITDFLAWLPYVRLQITDFLAWLSWLGFLGLASLCHFQGSGLVQ